MPNLRDSRRKAPIVTRSDRYTTVLLNSGSRNLNPLWGNRTAGPEPMLYAIRRPYAARRRRTGFLNDLRKPRACFSRGSGDAA